MTQRRGEITERYRLAAERWVELDSAARLLEESKTAVLSQKMAAMGDMPVSRAETAVKASEAWESYIGRMVEARTAANHAKVQMEFLRMQFHEWISLDANARQERKMG